MLKKFTHNSVKRNAFLVMMVALSAAPLVQMPAAANDLASLFGKSEQKKFLSVHQAFQPKISQNGDTITVHFSVTPEHYIYQDKLSLTLPEGVSAQAWEFNQPASWVEDPTFGRMAVFENDFIATAKLISTKDVQGQAALRWQGCAKAGLCYPPEKTAVNIVLSANKVAQQTPKAPSASPKADAATQPLANQVHPLTSSLTTKKSDNSNAGNNNNNTNDSNSLATASQISQAPQTTMAQADVNEQPNSRATDGVSPVNPNVSDVGATLGEMDVASDVFLNGMDGANLTGAASAVDNASASAAPNATQTYTLSHQIPENQNSQNPLVMIALLFFAGLLLAFTPCVYPMIPIVANIVARKHASDAGSAKRGFLLAAAYGVGVASAYGALGVLIAWFGQALGVANWLQKPAVLLVAAALFALFAVMTAGWLQIRLPSKLSNALQQKSQLADSKLGSLGGSFLAGVLSALVVSPCVSAPMAGALTAVSVSANPIFGFAALFALGLGLSAPLMLMGAAQGKWLPKAGEWMLRVREFGALLLLGVACLLLERVFLSSWMLLVWALWFALFAAWLWRFEHRGVRVLSALPLAWVLCLMLGLAMGSKDAWQPLAKLTQPNSENRANDIHITNLAQLDEILSRNEKVLVDLTADWCIECRIMERTLFTNRPEMLQNYQVVKLDITETTADSQAVLQRYQLFGPPALLIYKSGKLERILLGETKRDDFEQVLAQY